MIGSVAARPEIPCVELILVRVGSQELAIDVMSVQEIRRWTEPTPLIQAPCCISGVINLRGTPLPIIDLGLRLGITVFDPAMPERHGNSVIIVVQSHAQHFGLVVDGVSELLRVERGEIKPAPAPGTDGSAGLVCGLVARGERMLSVIAPESLFPEAAAPARQAARCEDVAA